MNIPFLSFGDQNKLVEAEIREAFERVFSSNWYILGKELNSFEQQYAKFNEVKHCVGVANGLDALHIALQTLGIGAGDEVIVPSNTYVATWLAISQVGAVIVPVEPSAYTYNIDPQNIAGAITSRTKAIMPVHLYGQACEMDAIMDLATRNGLYVVEDNAQAQGAKYNGRLCGGFGDINATSFYPTKNLGAYGDAGALTTNNPELAEKASMIRNYGSNQKYYNEVIGINSRLDELQAAFLKVKLPYLRQWNEQRKTLAGEYMKALSGVDNLILPQTTPSAEHIYHLFVIRSNRRDELEAFLRCKNIGTAIHYPVTPSRQKAYQHLGYAKGVFPIAEELAETSLSLPLNPGMHIKEITYVCDAIKAFHA